MTDSLSMAEARRITSTAPSEFGDAFDFTGADFWGWCREAGFKRYEVLHLAGPCSAAIAYK